MTLLALAMMGVVLLVTDFLFGNTAAVVTTVALVFLFAAVWYLTPLQRRDGDS